MDEQERLAQIARVEQALRNPGVPQTERARLTELMTYLRNPGQRPSREPYKPEDLGDLITRQQQRQGNDMQLGLHPVDAIGKAATGIGEGLLDFGSGVVELNNRATAQKMSDAAQIGRSVDTAVKSGLLSKSIVDGVRQANSQKQAGQQRRDPMVGGLAPTGPADADPEVTALDAAMKSTEEDAPPVIPDLPFPAPTQGPSTFPDTIHKYKVRQDANVPAPEFSTQHDPEVVVPKVPVPAKTYDPTDTYDRMETTLLGKRIYPDRIPDYSRDESGMGGYSGDRTMAQRIAQIRAHQAQRAADRAMSEPSPGYTPAYTVNTQRIHGMSPETEANVDRLRDERLAGKRARMENVIANTRQMFTPDQERQLREGGWTGANSPGIASNPYVFQAMLSQAVRDKQKQDMESRKLDIEDKRVESADAATKAKVELLRGGEKESPGDAQKRAFERAEMKVKFMALVEGMTDPAQRARAVRMGDELFGEGWYESPTSAAPSEPEGDTKRPGHVAENLLAPAKNLPKRAGETVNPMPPRGPGDIAAQGSPVYDLTRQVMEGITGHADPLNSIWDWLMGRAKEEDVKGDFRVGIERELVPEGPKNTEFKKGNR